MSTAAELFRPIEPAVPPGLAAARVDRRFSVEEAARKAGLLPDEVTWLEEGRVYRFRSTDEAIAAAVLYAAAFGITHREARRLAGLPWSPFAREAYGRSRLLSLAAVAAAVAALGIAVVAPSRFAHDPGVAPPLAAEAALPPPWRISVDVLNGSGDIHHTRRVADRILALAYGVRRVARANRFDYPATAVYYEPGGLAVAERLARQLGVGDAAAAGWDERTPARRDRRPGPRARRDVGTAGAYGPTSGVRSSRRRCFSAGGIGSTAAWRTKRRRCTSKR